MANKVVMLVGFVVFGKDKKEPELQEYRPSGRKYLNFAVAVRGSMKDEETGDYPLEFESVRIEGDEAERAARYLKYGSNVVIWGEERKWRGKDGKIRKYYKAPLDAFKFFDTKKGGGNGGKKSNKSTRDDDEFGGDFGGPEGGGSDDIPF